MEAVLYKKGVDPYTVHSKEELDYHLGQGWFKSQKDSEEADKPVVVAKPIIHNQPSTQEIIDAKVHELQEIVKAKDVELADLQADFDATVKELNAKIEAMKDLLKPSTENMAAEKSAE